MNYLKNKKAFTLVELIVVITILAILGTIAFISLQSYSRDARDSKRINNLKSMEKLLAVQQAKSGKVPIPDNYLDITLTGSTMTYQGVLGDTAKSLIGYSSKDGEEENTSYIYSTNSNLTKYQILTFLEGSLIKESKIPVNNTYANTTTFPYTKGNRLGILINPVTNNPINEDFSGTLELLDLSTDYTAYYSNLLSTTDQGLELGISIQNNVKSINDRCPEGFILVPGNASFDTQDFCISKYEMTYTKSDSPGTPDSVDGGTNHNTYAYNSSLSIASRIDYPIADITQQEAIDSCASIGAHLVTNDEWMTVARSIESNSKNWSEGKVGEGYIYNGNSNVSGDTGVGCSDSTGPRDRGTTTGGLDDFALASSRTTCDEKRQLVLTNGNIIWDFSGNAREHVNKANTLDGSGYGTGPTVIADTTGTWTSWQHPSISDSERGEYGPKTPDAGVNEGIGSMYHNTVGYGNIFVRGGGMGDGNLAGIYELVNTNGSSNSHRYVTFRCAYQ